MSRLLVLGGVPCLALNRPYQLVHEHIAIGVNNPDLKHFVTPSFLRTLLQPLRT